jgi:PilZ domain
MYDPKLTNSKRWLKNRRSQRIDLNVPVVVYRPPNEGPQFYESTQTLVVSAHGALMALTDMVAPRQRLLLQNTDSGEQQECRVVYVKKEPTGPPKVAVEFTRPAPSFWHLAFPPADWTGKS